MMRTLRPIIILACTATVLAISRCGTAANRAPVDIPMPPVGRQVTTMPTDEHKTQSTAPRPTTTPRGRP